LSSRYRGFGFGLGLGFGSGGDSGSSSPPSAASTAPSTATAALIAVTATSFVMPAAICTIPPTILKPPRTVLNTASELMTLGLRIWRRGHRQSPTLRRMVVHVEGKGRRTPSHQSSPGVQRRARAPGRRFVRRGASSRCPAAVTARRASSCESRCMITPHEARIDIGPMEYLPRGAMCTGTVTKVHVTSFDAYARCRTRQSVPCRQSGPCRRRRLDHERGGHVPRLGPSFHGSAWRGRVPSCSNAS
jgi:hypothetical protein